MSIDPATSPVWSGCGAPRSRPISEADHVHSTTSCVLAACDNWNTGLCSTPLKCSFKSASAVACILKNWYTPQWKWSRAKAFKNAQLKAPWTVPSMGNSAHHSRSLQA
eukprot:CAMPEP_0117590116 /NCGR_PEP_ID=MMETSP0784-20121206/70797_1 /TAXON_ID=39447 /ORGANISM="" /LENGTH=107 /DNA_ID=CAMNT_0005391689 /DNA_START=34 /DNA_END=353 /DNA_ORIENTATION=+